MFDFPRPANSMSAPLNGFASHLRRTHVGMVALALAATMLPGAHAAARHAAKSTPAPVAHRAAPSHAVAHNAAHVRSAAPHAGAATVAQLTSVRRASHTTTAPGRAVGHHVQVATFPARGYTTLAAMAAAEHTAPKAKRSIIFAPPQRSTERDSGTEQSAEDRVHAWYRTRGAGDAIAAAPSADSPSSNAPQRTTIPAAANFASRTTPETDIALASRNSTAPDPDRALPKQAENLRSPAAVTSTRSTSDDDAAFAEASNIPSTAPTERVPAPFIHGDLLAGAAHAAPPAKTATLFAKADTPSVTHIDPRGDAEVLSGAPTSTAVTIHLQPGETVPMPTPKAAPVLRSPAPAVSVVAAAANKPKLDPRVGTSMAQQTFEGDDDALPGRVVVAGKAARADLLTKPAVLSAGGNGYDVDLSGGPLVKVDLYDSVGKLILLPAMKGSHEILVHQNRMAIADGLDRVEDDNQLLDMRRLKLLVALPDNDGMQPDGRLPMNRRFARPWTIRFLNDLSRAHFARFHTPLIVTSAVRTVAFQRRLVLTNGNAAPPTGEVASPHLYGQAVDIAKHGMSMTEIAWMRSYLTPVESAGKIDVEEEFQQSCFHMSVYRRYLGLPAPRSTPAPEVAPSRVLQQAKATPVKRRHIPTALLATGLR